MRFANEQYTLIVSFIPDSSESKKSDIDSTLSSVEDPWKSMEQNILDDKDRAYLVELLSNLGDNPKSKMADHMGTRRDDIPGGKNSKILLDLAFSVDLRFQ